MSDALTIAEIEEQYLELLPSRTVLSVLSLVGGLADNLGLPGGNLGLPGGDELGMAGGDDLGMAGAPGIGDNIGTPGAGENVENTVEVPPDSGTPTQP